MNELPDQVVFIGQLVIAMSAVAPVFLWIVKRFLQGYDSKHDRIDKAIEKHVDATNESIRSLHIRIDRLTERMPHEYYRRDEANSMGQRLERIETMLQTLVSAITTRKD